VQAPQRTSDVTVEAFDVADRRLLPVAGAIRPEEGGTDTVDNDDADSSDAALVDDGGRRAPTLNRRRVKPKSTNDRNAAVRSQQADEMLRAEVRGAHPPACVPA
jgi:hypothetical protein